MNPWILEEGVQLCRLIELAIANYNAHCGLGGGVLHKGQSSKDLDVFIYCRKTKDEFDKDRILAALAVIGITYLSDRGRTHAQYGDEKDVRQMEFQGRRVDIFFLV